MKQETSTDCAIGTAIQIPHTFIKATIRHAIGIAVSVSHCLIASTAGNGKNCTASPQIGNLISESKTSLLMCVCKYKRKKKSLDIYPSLTHTVKQNLATLPSHKQR